MKSGTLLSLILASQFLPAHALDISGKVVDKRFAPLSGVQVCLESNPAACAVSAQDGAFHFTGVVNLGAGEPALPGYGFALRRGALTLDAPRAGAARLDWFDAGGRKRAASRDLDLAPGSNAIAIPAGMREGLAILRLSVAGASMTWKAVWDRGSLRGLGGAPEAAQAPIAALSKSAAAGTLVAAKSGYASASYTPAAEKETGSIIVLGGVGEKVSLLFDGKTLNGWLPSSGKLLGNATGSWEVRNGTLHSLGTVRGSLVTKDDYASFRLIFKVQQFTTGTGRHWASILAWGTRPPPNDALGAPQFGVPNGAYWDYRPGFPGEGKAYFTYTAPGIDKYKLAQCEMLAKASTGVIRVACCPSTGSLPCKATEYLTFKDPKMAGKAPGPIGLQIHNTGLVDEYKDITIEVDPLVDDLITTK